MTEEPSAPDEKPQADNAGRWPAVVLAVVAIVVSQTVPLALQQGTSLPELLMGLALCGSAPVLIREVVRRRGGGWPSLMLFGAGYAAFEYGLLRQDWLNPSQFSFHMFRFEQRYLGEDHSFEVLGVLWPTAINVVFTAAWTIALPILLTELVFRDRRDQPWLRCTGIVTWGTVLALGSLGMWGFMWADWSSPYSDRGRGTALALGSLGASGFKSLGSLGASGFAWAEYSPLSCDQEVRRVSVLAVAVVAAGLIAAGWWSTTALRGRAEPVDVPAPGAAIAGLVALAGAGTWLGTGYASDYTLSTEGVLLWYLLLLVGAVWLIRTWLSRPGFDDRHRLACYAGALAAYAIGGFLTSLPTDGRPVLDVIAFEVIVLDVIVCVVAAALLALLARRLRPSSRDTDPQES
ncbi:hypothetical protein [Nocardia altamirensis]|uniref:hypothetical protein n=1 Tax=Nocardia altamirensis TaxID=472158 RepID=UPI0008403212|nr:hypothetical protein [Nocardia altamirensis]